MDESHYREHDFLSSNPICTELLHGIPFRCGLFLSVQASIRSLHFLPPTRMIWFNPISISPSRN